MFEFLPHWVSLVPISIIVLAGMVLMVASVFVSIFILAIIAIEKIKAIKDNDYLL